MNIRYILVLATILVGSAIVFNNLDLMVTPGSIAMSMSLVSLAIMNVGLIMYFFKRMRSSEIPHSTQLLNLVASAIVIIVCFIQAIVR